MPNLYISSVVPTDARSKIISAYQRVYGSENVYVDPVENLQEDLDSVARSEITRAGIKVELPIVYVEQSGASFLLATKPGVHFMGTPPSYVTNDDRQLNQLLAEDGIGLTYVGDLLNEIRLLENFVTPDTQKTSSSGLIEIPFPTLSYEDRASRVRTYLDGLKPHLLTA